MDLIPAISIKNGRVAVAENGIYTFLTNAEGRYRSPVNVMREDGFLGEIVFVLDLDGLERNSPDLELVKRMAAFRDVWLDAGTTDAEGMMDLFVSDASKVVMGTMSMNSLDELAQALEMSDNLIFSVAYDGGVVSPDGNTAGAGLESLLARLEGMRIDNVMLLDLGSVRCSRLDMGAVSLLAGKCGNFYVAGRITADDIKPLEDAGVTGAIIDFRTLEGILRDRA